jgi:hypothetical protein
MHILDVVPLELVSMYCSLYNLKYSMIDIGYAHKEEKELQVQCRTRRE